MIDKSQGQSKLLIFKESLFAATPLQIKIICSVISQKDSDERVEQFDDLCGRQDGYSQPQIQTTAKIRRHRVPRHRKYIGDLGYASFVHLDRHLQKVVLDES